MKFISCITFMMILSIKVFGQSSGILTNLNNGTITPSPYLLYIGEGNVHPWGFSTVSSNGKFTVAYAGMGYSPSNNFNTNIGIGAVKIGTIGTLVVSNFTIWNHKKLQIIGAIEIGKNYFWKRCQLNWQLNEHWRVGVMSHWGHGGMLRWSSNKRDNKPPKWTVELGIYPFTDSFDTQRPNGSLRTEFSF